MFKWLARLRRSIQILPDVNPSPDETEAAYIPGFECQSSSLDHSRSIQGVFSRWHDKEDVIGDPPLWRLFMDDERKWSAQGRFAGKDINCGHYFALSPKAALSEAQHYEMQIENAAFVEADASFDKILNLTEPAARRRAYEAVTEASHRADTFIAEEMAEEVTGGTSLTDNVGKWAIGSGYEGILYFAPRLIWGPTTKAVAETRPPRPWDPSLLEYWEDVTRAHRDVNIVIFRSRYLTSCVRRHRTDNGPWMDNEQFGKAEEEIEAALADHPHYRKFDETYQAKKRRFRLVSVRYNDID